MGQPWVIYLASAACRDTGYVLRASNGQFTATRFSENPGVDYPMDLARVEAASAEEIARLWESYQGVLSVRSGQCRTRAGLGLPGQ